MYCHFLTLSLRSHGFVKRYQHYYISANCPIGGLAEFAQGSSLDTMWASARGKETMYHPSRLPTASLCLYVGMEPPVFRITNWVEDS